MDTSELLPILIVVGIIALFAGMVVFAVLSERNKRLAIEQQLTRLGFQAVSGGPAGMENEILRLFNVRTQREITWRSFYRKAGDGYDMYSVNLSYSSGEDTQYEGANSILFRSQQLYLPDFALMAMPPVSGVGKSLTYFAISLVNPLLERMSGLHRINFPDHPRFDERFIIMAADEAQVRSLFDRNLIGRLEGLEHSLRASGPWLAVSVSEYKPPAKGSQPISPEERLNGLVRTAAWLHAQFLDSAPPRPAASYTAAPAGLQPSVCPRCGAARPNDGLACRYCGELPVQTI